MITSTAKTTTNTNAYLDNQALVGKLYELFGKGDVRTILERVSEDAQWEHWETKSSAQAKGVPYLQAGKGKKGAADFLASLAATDEMRDFKVGGILAGGNKVCAEIVIEFKVKATGKILRDEQLHLWTLDDRGQVVAFRHYLDTAEHIEASAT
jgi:ketosteroid isomerase-like protein